MRKRILIVAAAIAAVVAAAVWFAAEESYVLRLNASLGTALNVDKHGKVTWGNVYGQEARGQVIRVALSHHAQNDPNTTGVDYVVSCQPDAKVPPAPNPDKPDTFKSADDICQYTSGDLGGFKLFTGVDPDGPGPLPAPEPLKFIDHVVVAVFPDCAGSTTNPDKQVTDNCDQDTSVNLGGDVRILRSGVQGFVKKICTFEKEYTPEELAAFGCTN